MHARWCCLLQRRNFNPTSWKTVVAVRTAAQLRIYAEVYTPLIFPPAFAYLISKLPNNSARRPHAAKVLRIELRAVFLLCQIVKLFLRPQISSIQLDRVDGLNRRVEQLCAAHWYSASLSNATLYLPPDPSSPGTYGNIHYLCHLVREIGNHGPV